MKKIIATVILAIGVLSTIGVIVARHKGILLLNGDAKNTLEEG